MKLKYYLRGLGLGILFATIISLFSGGTDSDNLTDAQIIQRAQALGMKLEDGSLLSENGGTEAGQNSGTVSDAQSKDKTPKPEPATEEGTGSSEKPEDTGNKKNKKDKNTDGGWRTHDSQGNLLNASGGAAKPADTNTASGSSVKPTDTNNAGGTSKPKDNIPDIDKNVKPEDKTTVSGSGNIPKQPSDPDIVRIEILKGEGCRLVAEDLQLQGVISDSEDFRKFMQARGLDGQLHTGLFDIPKNATYEQIKDILLKKD